MAASRSVMTSYQSLGEIDAALQGLLQAMAVATGPSGNLAEAAAIQQKISRIEQTRVQFARSMVPERVSVALVGSNLDIATLLSPFLASRVQIPPVAGEGEHQIVVNWHMAVTGISTIPPEVLATVDAIIFFYDGTSPSSVEGCIDLAQSTFESIVQHTRTHIHQRGAGSGPSGAPGTSSPGPAVAAKKKTSFFSFAKKPKDSAPGSSTPMGDSSGDPGDAGYGEDDFGPQASPGVAQQHSGGSHRTDYGPNRRIPMLGIGVCKSDLPDKEVWTVARSLFSLRLSCPVLGLALGNKNLQIRKQQENLARARLSAFLQHACVFAFTRQADCEFMYARLLRQVASTDGVALPPTLGLLPAPPRYSEQAAQQLELAERRRASRAGRRHKAGGGGLGGAGVILEADEEDEDDGGSVHGSSSSEDESDSDHDGVASRKISDAMKPGAKDSNNPSNMNNNSPDPALQILEDDEDGQFSRRNLELWEDDIVVVLHPNSPAAQAAYPLFGPLMQAKYGPGSPYMQQLAQREQQKQAALQQQQQQRNSQNQLQTPQAQQSPQQSQQHASASAASGSVASSANASPKPPGNSIGASLVVSSAASPAVNPDDSVPATATASPKLQLVGKRPAHHSGAHRRPGSHRRSASQAATSLAELVLPEVLAQSVVGGVGAGAAGVVGSGPGGHHQRASSSIQLDQQDPLGSSLGAGGVCHASGVGGADEAGLGGAKEASAEVALVPDLCQVAFFDRVFLVPKEDLYPLYDAYRPPAVDLHSWIEGWVLLRSNRRLRHRPLYAIGRKGQINLYKVKVPKGNKPLKKDQYEAQGLIPVPGSDGGYLNRHTPVGLITIDKTTEILRPEQLMAGGLGGVGAGLGSGGSPGSLHGSPGSVSGTGGLQGSSGSQRGGPGSPGGPGSHPGLPSSGAPPLPGHLPPAPGSLQRQRSGSLQRQRSGSAAAAPSMSAFGAVDSGSAASGLGVSGGAGGPGAAQLQPGQLQELVIVTDDQSRHVLRMDSVSAMSRWAVALQAMVDDAENSDFNDISESARLECMEELHRTLDFTTLVSDEIGLELFRKFCAESFVGENIQFYCEAQDWRARVAAGLRSEAHSGKPESKQAAAGGWRLEMAQEALNIMSTYFTVGSDNEINISQFMSSVLHQRLAGRPEELAPRLDGTEFDAVLKEVANLMHTNSFQRFLDSHKYLGLYAEKVLRRERQTYAQQLEELEGRAKASMSKALTTRKDSIASSISGGPGSSGGSPMVGPAGHATLPGGVGGVGGASPGGVGNHPGTGMTLPASPLLGLVTGGRGAAKGWRQRPRTQRPGVFTTSPAGAITSTSSPVVTTTTNVAVSDASAHNQSAGDANNSVSNNEELLGLVQWPAGDDELPSPVPSAPGSQPGAASASGSNTSGSSLHHPSMLAPATASAKKVGGQAVRLSHVRFQSRDLLLSPLVTTALLASPNGGGPGFDLRKGFDENPVLQHLKLHGNNAGSGAAGGLAAGLTPHELKQQLAQVEHLQQPLVGVAESYRALPEPVRALLAEMGIRPVMVPERPLAVQPRLTAALRWTGALWQGWIGLQEARPPASVLRGAGLGGQHHSRGRNISLDGFALPGAASSSLGASSGGAGGFRTLSGQPSATASASQGVPGSSLVLVASSGAVLGSSSVNLSGPGAAPSASGSAPSGAGMVGNSSSGGASSRAPRSLGLRLPPLQTGSSGSGGGSGAPLHQRNPSLASLGSVGGTGGDAADSWLNSPSNSGAAGRRKQVWLRPFWAVVLPHCVRLFARPPNPQVLMQQLQQRTQMPERLGSLGRSSSFIGGLARRRLLSSESFHELRDDAAAAAGASGTPGSTESATNSNSSVSSGGISLDLANALSPDPLPVLQLAFSPELRVFHVRARAMVELRGLDPQLSTGGRRSVRLHFPLAGALPATGDPVVASNALASLGTAAGGSGGASGATGSPSQSSPGMMGVSGGGSSGNTGLSSSGEPRLAFASDAMLLPDLHTTLTAATGPTTGPAATHSNLGSISGPAPTPGSAVASPLLSPKGSPMMGPAGAGAATFVPAVRLPLSTGGPQGGHSSHNSHNTSASSSATSTSSPVTQFRSHWEFGVRRLVLVGAAQHWLRTVFMRRDVGLADEIPLGLGRPVPASASGAGAVSLTLEAAAKNSSTSASVPVNSQTAFSANTAAGGPGGVGSASVTGGGDPLVAPHQLERRYSVSVSVAPRQSVLKRRVGGHGNGSGGSGKFKKQAAQAPPPPPPPPLSEDDSDSSASSSSPEAANRHRRAANTTNVKNKDKDKTSEHRVMAGDCCQICAWAAGASVKAQTGLPEPAFYCYGCRMFLCANCDQHRHGLEPLPSGPGSTATAPVPPPPAVNPDGVPLPPVPGGNHFRIALRPHAAFTAAPAASSSSSSSDTPSLTVSVTTSAPTQPAASLKPLKTPSSSRDSRQHRSSRRRSRGSGRRRGGSHSSDESSSSSSSSSDDDDDSSSSSSSSSSDSSSDSSSSDMGLDSDSETESDDDDYPGPGVHPEDVDTSDSEAAERRRAVYGRKPASASTEELLGQQRRQEKLARREQRRQEKLAQREARKKRKEEKAKRKEKERLKKDRKKKKSKDKKGKDKQSKDKTEKKEDNEAKAASVSPVPAQATIDQSGTGAGVSGASRVSTVVPVVLGVPDVPAPATQQSKVFPSEAPEPSRPRHRPRQPSQSLTFVPAQLGMSPPASPSPVGAPAGVSGPIAASVASPVASPATPAAASGGGGRHRRTPSALSFRPFPLMGASGSPQPSPGISPVPGPGSSGTSGVTGSVASPESSPQPEYASLVLVPNPETVSVASEASIEPVSAAAAAAVGDQGQEGAPAGVQSRHARTPSKSAAPSASGGDKKKSKVKSDKKKKAKKAKKTKKTKKAKKDDKKKSKAKAKSNKSSKKSSKKKSRRRNSSSSSSSSSSSGSSSSSDDDDDDSSSSASSSSSDESSSTNSSSSSEDSSDDSDDSDNTTGSSSEDEGAAAKRKEERRRARMAARKLARDAQRRR